MENNTAELEARVQKLETLTQIRDRGLILNAILQNRVQQSALSGAVVAAAGAITPDASITTVGTLGKLRISANLSGIAAGVAAGVHGVLQVKVGAGAFTTVYTWAAFASAAHIDLSSVFEFDSGAAPGTVISVHWQTTAGDDALTLGGVAGAGINGATLLVEELP